MGVSAEATTPFFWWGSALDRRSARSLRWLVGQGMLGEPTASLLAVAVARGGSLAVVAEPSGAGKSTLLSAALAHLRPDAVPIFLRGGYESFAVLDDPSLVPGRGVLLANEISPHLPVYLWGGRLERALAVARRGFALHATAHAADAETFIHLLSCPPLDLPRSAVAAFDLVAAIDADDRRRRVSGVWAIAETAGGAHAILVCDGDAEGGRIVAGLQQAAAVGWRPEWEIPDEDALAAVGDRLDAVFALGPGSAAPGAMLARAERERLRESGRLP